MSKNIPKKNTPKAEPVEYKKTAKEEKREASHHAIDCDKVGEIAIHFGFTIIKTPHITTSDISQAKQFKDFDYYGDAEEKISLMRWYMDENMQNGPQPLMIHYKKPLIGGTAQKKPTKEMYGLEIMGSNRSTSEALLIKTTLAILSDLGYNDVYIDVNSIGDRESISKFERELGTHFRKHAHSVPAKIREGMKKNHYTILTSVHPDAEEIQKNTPQTISALSEAGRIHFKEVLEYIEAFETAYKIQHKVLSNKMYACHTVFEIREPVDKKDDEGVMLAYGYRYNYLAKKIGGKKDIPCVGVTILVKKHPSVTKKVIIKNIKKPRFYLVQLGATAKLKALNVVEHLRKNKIPVYHSLTKDKIIGQLSGAEYMKATHVLIIGQKEAIENTIVVRDMITRKQETVPLSSMVVP